MTVISSRANPLFKRLRVLAGSAQRQRREGVALLEGTHLANAYLDMRSTPEDGVDRRSQQGGPHGAQHSRQGIERCIVAQSAASRPEIAALLLRIDAIDPRLITCFDDALFEQVSPVADGGVGLLLLVPVPAPTVPARVTARCVILDGVQDAGNAGSILRSAAAAGVSLAFCMPGTANAWSTKVLRAAMGAHFVLHIVEDIQTDALADRLDVPVAITDSHGSATIYECDLREPVAWVFGNEGAGVSDGWRARAAHRLTIPQPGRIESLNVAAAAAVCLFEQNRQLNTPACRS